MTSYDFLRGLDRRTFLRIISFTGIGGLIYPHKLISSLVSITPSRVVIVEDNTATDGTLINGSTVQVMINSGIKAFAQQNDIGEAWKTLFPNINSFSNIAIKVNCINSSLPTHPVVTDAIINGLKQMVVGSTFFTENNIIIFDRYNSELQSSGYTLNTSNSGVRCFGTNSSGVGYSDQSYNVNGIYQKISKIITEIADFIINISVLKNSSVAGVTLCLKNHFGTCHNPSSMHDNQCDPFIPALNALSPIMEKQCVNICDALLGIKSGSGGFPQFIANKIIISKDIVALDYWGRTILEDNGCTTISLAHHIDTAATEYSLGTNDPSQMDVVNITNPTIPVELASFEVSIVDQKVHLTWKTETETNNYGFEIERSIGSDWKTIGFVKGKGTTTMPHNYEFVDKLSDIGTFVSVIHYRLKQIDYDGSFEYSKILSVQMNSPFDYQLKQNYPNPFNNQTQISFYITKPGEVKLIIFDSIGRRVRRLVNKTLKAGWHQVPWDGYNDSGKLVASGVYFCQLTTEGFQKSIIMQLMK